MPKKFNKGRCEPRAMQLSSDAGMKAEDLVLDIQKHQQDSVGEHLPRALPLWKRGRPGNFMGRHASGYQVCSAAALTLATT